MKIPWSKRNKALLVVDTQSGFITERNKYIIANINKLIEATAYDCFVTAVFHAEKNSLWDKQTNWILPKDQNFKILDELAGLLQEKDCIRLEKEAKSAFKGSINLLTEFNKRGVKEVHIVGLDANDCVLATAYESFDLGYFTYVIEECTESSSSKKIRDAALALLRHVNLTNNSCIENLTFIEI